MWCRGGVAAAGEAGGGGAVGAAVRGHEPHRAAAPAGAVGPLLPGPRRRALPQGAWVPHASGQLGHCVAQLTGASCALSPVVGATSCATLAACHEAASCNKSQAFLLAGLVDALQARPVEDHQRVLFSLRP